MKKSLALALMLGSLSVGAFARDTLVKIPLADVLAMPEAQSELDGSVKFYLAGAKTPKVQKRMGTDTSNPKTNGANKSDEVGCRWAALSALKAFQHKAKAQGANAVIDIVSYYKREETKSDTTFDCHAGAIIIGVALRGTYATVAP